MPTLSRKALAASFKQVVENVVRYQQDLEGHSDLIARMSRHPAWYAVRAEDGRWLFGPSKFVGYVGNTAEQYLSSYDRRDGGETERTLDDWFEPVTWSRLLDENSNPSFGIFFLATARSRIDENASALPESARRRSQRYHPCRARDALSDRITANPEICGGRPCIRGTRVRVSDILDMISEGVSADEIVHDYPYLERADVAAALAYAARAVDHR